MQELLQNYLRWGLPGVKYDNAIIQYSARSHDDHSKYNVIFQYNDDENKVIKNKGIEVDALDLLLFIENIEHAKP